MTLTWDAESPAVRPLPVRCATVWPTPVGAVSCGDEAVARCRVCHRAFCPLCLIPAGRCEDCEVRR